MAVGWALFFVVLAVPLQVMGLTSTCTQGADGTFLTGAVLSLLPLAIACGVFVRLSYRQRGGRLLVGLSFVSAALCCLLLFLTRDAWINTILFATPCGADFAGPFASSPGAVVVILVGYLLAPLAVLGTLIFVLVREARQRDAISRRPDGM